MKHENLENEILQMLEEVKSLLKELTSESQKENWLRTSEVKEKLGIGDEKIQNMRINGTLPYYKDEGIYWYPENQIDLLFQKWLVNRHFN